MTIAAVDWREADHGADRVPVRRRNRPVVRDARLGHCCVVGSHRSRTAAWNGARIAGARSTRRDCRLDVLPPAPGGAPDRRLCRRIRTRDVRTRGWHPGLRVCAAGAIDHRLCLHGRAGIGGRSSVSWSRRRHVRLLDEAACQSERREQPGTAPTERAGIDAPSVPELMHHGVEPGVAEPGCRPVCAAGGRGTARPSLICWRPHIRARTACDRLRRKARTTSGRSTSVNSWVRLDAGTIMPEACYVVPDAFDRAVGRRSGDAARAGHGAHRSAGGGSGGRSGADWGVGS